MAAMQDTPSTENGSRLLITKMELENFKSYGGVRVVGPFHKRFSSIVGPNGSGKSNNIDAMLFVFGKKAKKLRLNKVSELIHKSEQYPELEFCRVSVHFCDIIDKSEDPDDYEVVPGSELVVTRIAYKNNSSKYLVDGKSSTFTEVGALLRKRGIDLDNNRFLILQGEVEQIAMMPPKGQKDSDEGLLEFLEDIIGSNHYVEAIEESGKQLDEANERRAEHLQRAKTAETERDNLEGPRKEAEKSILKERQIRVERNKLVQKHLLDSQRNMESTQEKFSVLNERREYEMEKLRDKDGARKAIEKDMKKAEKELDKLTGEMQKTKDEIGGFERRSIKFGEDIKANKAYLKKLGSTIKKEEGNIKKQQEKGVELEESLPELEQNITKVARQKELAEEKLEELLDGVRDETEGLREQLETKQTEMAPIKKQVSELEAELSTTTTEIELLRSGPVEAQKELGQIDADIARMESGSQLEELKQSEREQKKLEARVGGVEKEISAKEAEERELSGQKKEIIARCEEAKAALNSQGGRSRGVVGQLMQAAKKGGKLSKAGLIGRLGDLGSIDQKYDVAISTACGMLDYMVVETADGGQACIEYLKKHNLGRISLVVLDQIRSRAERGMTQPFQCPSKARRLFDLVTPAEERLQPAFYFALRNTLVTSDLDTAVSFAYQGNRPVHRVVTLNGDLIDTSGTLSGGGKSVKRGGMGSSAAVAKDDVTQREVDELEREAERVGEQLAECRRALATLREERKTVVLRLKQLAKLLPQLEMTIESDAKTVEELKARRPALLPLTEMSAEDEARVAELEGEIEAARRAAKKTTTLFERLQGEVDALQGRILEAGGAPVKKQRAKVDKLAEELDGAESALAEAQVNRKEAEKGAAKAEKALQRAVEEREQLQAKQEELAASMEELTESAGQVAEAYEAAKAACGAKQAEIDAMKGEMDGVQKEIDKIRTVDVDISDQLEEYSKVIADNKKKHQYWEKEWAELKEVHAKDWEEWGELLIDDDEEEEESPSVEAEQEGEENRAGEDAEGSDEWKGNLATLPEDYLTALDKEALKHELCELEQERDAMLKTVNMTAIREYKKKSEEYRQRFSELEKVTADRDAVRTKFEDLRRKRLEEFMEGFGQITLKLKEMYQMITLGGDAELELVDSLDPFSEGIVFSVRPPKKSWKNIANLSGGEKTLSSLALVFALHHYKPTPLYVMDEIDAALDFKNVSIVANYIKERTKNAQFIIISLRNNMFELADRLVGIYKTNNTTKSVTINPRLMNAPSSVQQAGVGASTVSEPLSDRTNAQQPELIA